MMDGSALRMYCMLPGVNGPSLPSSPGEETADTGLSESLYNSDTTAEVSWLSRLFTPGSPEGD